MKDKVNKITCADARDYLKELPDGCVNCCVTSPPYWGLRDYGVDGQLGLEETVDGYVGKMVEIFREVRRVLKRDGTLWLNLGDTYAGSWGAQSRNCAGKQAAQKRGSGTGSIERMPGLKPKDLIGIPWRVAFALQTDGLYLRQEIIWHKPNAMPESVRDRCTRAHDTIFLLSKNRRYYFDADAIKEPVSGSSHDRGNGASRKAKSVPCGANSRVHVSRVGNPPQPRSNESMSAAITGLVDFRNRRSVWTIPIGPCVESHYATFPTAIVSPCVLAGCPEGGVVLDPFIGTGTTALVALSLNRRFLGCDLSPDYVAMAERRIHNEAGLLLEGPACS